jgi:hypothetical protein
MIFIFVDRVKLIVFPSSVSTLNGGQGGPRGAKAVGRGCHKAWYGGID